MRFNTFTRQRQLLVLILSVYFALAIVYAWSVPKWNAPDEPSHFNYVKTIAVTGTLPVLQVGDYDFDYLEKAKAARFPDTLPVDSIRYESHQPPLYYVLATPVLLATSGLTVDLQVVSIRLLSAFLSALTIVVTFSIGQAVFGDDVHVPLAAAAFVAFLPMNVFLSASINNDALANLLLSVLLLLLIKYLHGKAPAIGDRASDVASSSLAKRIIVGDRRLLAIGIVLGLSLLTKATDYVGAIVILAAVALRAFNEPASERKLNALANASRYVALRLAYVYGIALLIASWWFVRNAMVYGDLDILGLKRHDIVVVGQPLSGPINLAVVKHFVTMAFKSFWGVFGWMGILMDQRIYDTLALLTLVAVTGFVLYAAHLITSHERRRHHEKMSMLLLLLTAALVAAGWLQYNLVYMQPQGRYLFPAISAIAVFFVLGLRELVNKAHLPKLFCAIFGLLALLDVYALYRYILPQLS